MSEILIKKYEVYKYDDLSADTKQTAFENWRDNQTEWHWIDENINSMKAFAKNFNVIIWDYSLGGQGDYVKFRFDEHYQKDMSLDIADMEYVRLWKYLKNNNYEHVKRNFPERNNPGTDVQKTLNPEVTTIHDCCPFTGYCMDETLLDNIRAFLERPYKTTYYDLINSCFDKWLKACHDEMEYQQSEEHFKETSCCNDFKFLENGTIYHD